MPMSLTSLASRQLGRAWNSKSPPPTATASFIYPIHFLSMSLHGKDCKALYKVVTSSFRALTVFIFAFTIIKTWYFINLWLKYWIKEIFIASQSDLQVNQTKTAGSMWTLRVSLGQERSNGKLVFKIILLAYTFMFSLSH